MGDADLCRPAVSAFRPNVRWSLGARVSRKPRNSEFSVEIPRAWKNGTSACTDRLTGTIRLIDRKLR
jgi:hypothetical protein